METKLSSKVPLKYACELCRYYTNYSKDYNKHLLTKKHISVSKEIDGNIKEIENVLTCQNCEKKFKTNSGLWKHKKICNFTQEKVENITEEKHKIYGINKDEPSDKQLIMMLLKQNSEIIKENSEIIKENSELRKEQADIKELILEIVKNGTINNSNNTTNTNSHNKAFNLQFFLNETCKNAMNITDFVDSIKLQLSDFMTMCEIGFVEGISNIIVKNLNSLDETVRPIHCTDQKRETFYVKDKNIWEKDDDEKKKMKQMVKSVAYKNEKLMKTYKEKYPDYNNPDSKRSDQYSKIMIEAMDCKDDSREKIIKNISKAITIKSK
jgi:hypothetical protein